MLRKEHMKNPHEYSLIETGHDWTLYWAELILEQIRCGL
jgi:hypothetical protein